MSYRLSVSYTANREVRIASGVAVSRLRKEKETVAGQPLDISAKVQRADQGTSEESLKRAERGARPGWGALGRQDRGFNSGTRHALLECGAVCDMWHGRNAVVLTGTLPGSTDEANEVIAANSAYIVNRINQYCRRLSKGGLWCFYVWEWQSRGALHIHYCVADSDRSGLARMRAGWRDFWVDVLEALTRKSGVDLFRRSGGGTWRGQADKIQADAQFVKKSVAAYFAKYAGKGYHAEVSKKLKSKRIRRYVPSRWAGWSRPVSRAMKMCRWKFEIEGDRRSIERRLDEITGFMGAFAVKQNVWQWQCIPGTTRAYYFRTEDLLEVQGKVESMLSSGANFSEKGCRKEIERIALNPGLRLSFSNWLRRQKDTRANPMWSSLFEAYVQGRCTEKGEMELEMYAREFLARKRYVS